VGKPKSKSKPQELVNVGGHYFPKVKKARQALKEHAEEIYQEYRQAIQTALSAGEYEPALKAYQHLLDHMPEEDGERLLDASVDKVKPIDSGPNGPVINIGLRIGGTEPVKQLDPVIIDVLSK